MAVYGDELYHYGADYHRRSGVCGHHGYLGMPEGSQTMERQYQGGCGGYGGLAHRGRCTVLFPGVE